MVEEVKEIKEENKEQPKKKFNKKLFIRISVVIIIALIIFSLVRYKSLHPEFSTLRIFFIFIGLIVFGLIVFFSNEIYTYLKRDKIKKDEGELPEAVGEEDMINISRDIIEKPLSKGGYENHIKMIANRKNRKSGGNSLFHIKIIPVFNDVDFSSGNEIMWFNFMFNSHFPNNPSVFFNLNDRQVDLILDRMAQNPEVKDIEERVSIDPLSGREIRERRTYNKKRRKEEDKKVDET